MPLMQRLVLDSRETVLVAPRQILRRKVVCAAHISGPREGQRVFRQDGSAGPIRAGAQVKTVPVALPGNSRISINAGPLETPGVAA